MYVCFKTYVPKIPVWTVVLALMRATHSPVSVQQDTLVTLVVKVSGTASLIMFKKISLLYENKVSLCEMSIA